MPRLFLLGSILIAAVILIGLRCAARADEPKSAVRPERSAFAWAAVTVHDFGAVGDGTADDTAAIQKAVDAKVGDVCFPRGVYRISRPLVIDLDAVGPTSVAGTGTARIVMTGPGPAVKLRTFLRSNRG